jgi:hypothetical protein
MTALQGTRAAGTHECHVPAAGTHLAASTPGNRGYATGRENYLVRHCVLEAARDSGEAGQARMDEVAAAIRQVIRL